MSLRTFAKGSGTVMVVMLSMLVARPATAMEPSPTPNTIIVHEEPGVVTVTVGNPNAKTKEIPTIDSPIRPMYVGDNSAAHCRIPGVGPTPTCQFNIHKSASRTETPPGGSPGLFKSYGTAFVDVYSIFRTQADYYDTHSYSFWGGSNPYNATSIRHEDFWDIDYIAVGWSFGGAPGGTVNHGNGRLSYYHVFSNNYRIEHNVQHMYIGVSGGSVTKVKYEVHGDYCFGTVCFTTDAYSRVALP